MAWNPNVPTVTNRVQDDLDAIRENFQHLDQLAERVDELQTVSELAPVANDLQTVSELAPYVQAILDSRIVEMGSNANGEYVRWENGWQICFGGRKTADEYLNNNTYRLLWIYPAAFVSTPSAVGTRSSDGTAKSVRLVGPSIRSIGSTQVNYYIDNPNGDFADGETWYIYPIAIGRWK